MSTRPLFTAKHYVAVAERIKRIATYNADAARITYLEMGDLFQGDNYEFDRDKFRTACGQDHHRNYGGTPNDR